MNDTVPPSGAGRHHITFLILAGAYFGLHALSLSAVSIVGLRCPHGILIASIGIGLYSGIGLTCDVAVGVASTRFGVPMILRSGVALCAAGVVSLFAFSGVPGAVVGASILGLGTSFLNAPILAGVANTAPIAKQIVSQSINAGIQRTGALCATVFLVGLTVHSDTSLLALGMAISLGVILLGSFLIGTPAPTDDLVFGSLRSGFVALGLMLRHSHGYQVAVIGNLATVMLVVYGNSYLVSALRRIDHHELLAPGLALREVVAVLIALTVLRRASLDVVRTVWIVSTLAGAAGLAVLPLADASPVVCLLLISMHGAAISSGIVFTNTMIHFSFPTNRKAIGFAGESVVARLFGITFPLTMAGLGDSGPALGGLLVLVLGVLIVAFVAVRIGSSPAQPHS